MSMARGGHHGGGFHSGGHHSSGGFSGGSHKSGGSHYHGGTGRSYSNDDYEDTLLNSLVPVALIFLFVVIRIVAFLGEIGCFNILNSFVMFVSLILFIIAIRDDGEYSGIYQLRRRELPYNCEPIYYVDSIYYKYNEVSDGYSWYDDKHFFLDFYSRHFREDNIKNAAPEIRKWPFILKIRQAVWIVSAIVWFCVNFFFYEVAILPFENMVMSDEAFAFVDELIFYLPAIIILICSIAMLIIQKVRGRLLRQICIKIVDENKTKTIVNETNDEIHEIQKSTWYHNECPNCSALATENDIRCHSCGTSLKILNYEQVSISNRHQVIPTSPKVPKKSAPATATKD